MRVSVIHVGILLLLAVGAAAQPRLDFEEGRVSMTGGTPGGEVVLFLAAHDQMDVVVAEVQRAAIVRDDDGDGRVVFDLYPRVPKFAVWLAVDLRSGQYAVSRTPSWSIEAGEEPGSPVLERQVEGAAVVRGRGRQLTSLVVRPGVGAWRARVADGHAADRDGERDGAVSLSLSEHSPLAASPAAPPVLQHGDVVLIVNPQDLQFGVVRVGEK